MSWIADLTRLLGFLQRYSRSVRGAKAMMATVVIAGAVSGLSNAGMIVVINSRLDHPEKPAGALLWGFIALCLVLPASRFVSGYVLLRMTARAAFDLRLRLAQRILAAPLRKLEELGPHRLIATMTDDIPVITDAIVSYPNLFMQIFIVVGCLAYLGWLAWPALLAVLVCMALGILSYQIPVRLASRYLSAGRESWDHIVKAIRGLTEGTKELKLNAGRRREFLTGSYEPAAASVLYNGVRGRGILHAASCWGHILFFVVVGLVLFLLPGVVTVGRSVLVGYTLILLYMMTPLEAIMSALPGLTNARVSVRKIEELGLSLEPEATEEAAGAGAAHLGASIELRGVTHSYGVEGEDRRFTLGPIDLSLRPGELVFLIGGNGSGKTTLAKLLCGLYLPEGGEIRVDGQAVTAANRETYRQLFSAVFADFFVFESVRGLGAEDPDQAGLPYIQKLGLEGILEVQEGKLSRTELSQGQRKRLALLCAYLEDRPCYLFDEWAADQDVGFKRLFYHQLLPELKERGKTVVVISHDDHFYSVADRVVKLDFGRVEFDRPPATAEAALAPAAMAVLP
jgi:putative ATP-binding cassette transporter